MADLPARPSGTTTGTLMVVSGFMNLLWSGSFLLCLPCVGGAALFPALVGIAELVIGITILGREPTDRVRAVSILGLLAGVLTANPFSTGLEIAALVTQSKKPEQIEG